MKLWGGRFNKTTDKLVEDFHSSISFDQRLYYWDIKGSIAHARMLGDTGIITKDEAKLIIKGLEEILAEIEAGEVQFDLANEDIHMNIEVLLTKKIGEVGKKLHTGRSRNDQVAVDTRMYLKAEIEEIQVLLKKLLRTILELSEKHLDTVMPGYTHLQPAQPITLAHHLMAYFQMFCRDYSRLEDCKDRFDLLPLGAGALAGTTFPLNREQVAKELGFKGVTLNSIDSVSDRDYIIEFLAAGSLLMMHLSRFCEELILWSSQEFKFIDMDDGCSTGSSMMPQKKNPDVAELVRGKTGRVYGHLVAMLTMMKALPLAYNKDMQEDKEAAFDAGDTVKDCLTVFIPMFDTITFNKDKIKEKLKYGFLNATDAADYLVKKGVPFRDAHEIIGLMVNYCIKHNKALEDLSMEEFKSFNPNFYEDVYDFIDIKNCGIRRNTIGGPSPEMVSKDIEKGKEYLGL